MRRFKIVQVVNAPAETLFFLSEDYAARLRWDPFVRDLQFLDGATAIAKGVATRTIAHNGLAMDTEFIAYDPPHVIAMKMLKGPAIFDSMAGSWRFRTQNDGSTEVTFIYSFQTRPNWLRPLLDRAVELVFKRDMKRRMAALVKEALSID